MVFSEPIKATLKDAASKLTGHRRRDFMAKVAEDYFSGSSRKTETLLAGIATVSNLGLHERRTEPA